MSYDSYADYTSNASAVSAPSAEEINALTANSALTTGTTNYQPDISATGSTGGVINTSANPITTNSGPVDASGGNGSIPSGLQNIATQGLNDAVISAQEFGIGSLTDLLRVGAQGTTTAASAPSAPTTQAQAGIPMWIWLVGGAAVLYFVLRK